MDALLLDPAEAETRVVFGMAEAEVAQRAQWRASAEVFRAVDATLREAAEHPEVFVDGAMLRGDAVEFAERAAVADLAVRLNLAEATVRDHGHTARLLRERLPLLWASFADGEVSTQNAREAAGIAVELPEGTWAAFDEQVGGPARALAPARFRARARAIRDRLHAVTAAERHKAAAADRRVWIEHDRDGMSWLNAYLPAEKAAQIGAALDTAAFDLLTADGEQRTMGQLRADILADLLTGVSSSATVGVTVALTIPVLTLLGHSDELPVLEGAGPIDIGTARRLAATAPSITRLLTDPVTRDILTMDPKRYRPTAALRRWLALTQVTCDFPGCGRRAANCDLDHTTDWAHGGHTTAANLAHRCRKHHTMKHQTRWQVQKPPGNGPALWTSPTGHTRTADPPPF